MRDDATITITVRGPRGPGQLIAHAICEMLLESSNAKVRLVDGDATDVDGAIEALHYHLPPQHVEIVTEVCP